MASGVPPRGVLTPKDSLRGKGSPRPSLLVEANSENPRSPANRPATNKNLPIDVDEQDAPLSKRKRVTFVQDDVNKQNTQYDQLQAQLRTTKLDLAQANRDSAHYNHLYFESKKDIDAREKELEKVCMELSLEKYRSSELEKEITNLKGQLEVKKLEATATEQNFKTAVAEREKAKAGEKEAVQNLTEKTEEVQKLKATLKANRHERESALRKFEEDKETLLQKSCDFELKLIKSEDSLRRLDRLEAALRKDSMERYMEFMRQIK